MSRYMSFDSVSENKSKARSVQPVNVTKHSLDEAIALIYDEDSKMNEKKLEGTKLQRKCWSASMKAHNLRFAAEIFTSDHQTTDILEELRASMMENNFSAAAKLLESLLQSSNKLLLPVIWKNAVVLFLNYYGSSQGCLEEFLEMCADRRLLQDKRKFIEALISMPGDLEEWSKSRKKENKQEINYRMLDVSENEDDIFFNIDERESEII